MKHTALFLIGLATLAVACGSSSSGNPPTPEQDGGADANDAETPTSWTRSYESLSPLGGGGSVWQGGFCVDTNGRVFFPGTRKTWEDRESDGVMLGASGETLWSMRADRGLNFATCDETGVSIAAQAGNEDVHVADGVVPAPPGLISPELVAAVDDTGHLRWGKLIEVGGTQTLSRTQGQTTWTVDESSQVDVGCGPIPSVEELSPETGRTDGEILAEFDEAGACRRSWRFVQHAGMTDVIVRASAGDGTGGNVVLWEGWRPDDQAHYDAALEHYDVDGNSVWVTHTFSKFGNCGVGYLARSESDGGYFVGRTLGFTNDAIITKISKDGQEQWTKTIGTWENGRLSGFASDAGGGLLIGGRFEHIEGDGKAQLCGKTYEVQGEGDGYAARLDDEGNCTWVRLFASPRFDQVNAIAASRADGAVVVAWEDWPEGQLEQVDPLVHMHITKFVPEQESP